MSSNAPYTHRRKRRFGCQTKKRSGAPSALKRSLTGGFFLACRIDRLIPLAALCLITCIATILNPDNGPLFMVAGDPNAAVGTTIGFVGDVIVPGHVAESVLRASLVYTIAWIPAAAIMGITVVGVGAAEPTAQLSQAKGIPGGATVLGQAVPQTTLFAIAYLLSHIAAFVLKTLAHGVPLTEAAWGWRLERCCRAACSYAQFTRCPPSLPPSAECPFSRSSCPCCSTSARCLHTQGRTSRETRR